MFINRMSVRSMGLVGLLTIGICSITPTASADDFVIEFFESAFIPTSVTLTAGDTVTWVWVAGDHTTTSGVSSNPGDNPGALFDEPINAANPSFTFTFSDPGVFPFFDRLNENGLVGTITVNPFEVTSGVVNNAFTPSDIQIFAGDQVRWQWIEGDHTITSGASSSPLDNPGALFNGFSTNGQQTFIYVFEDPGFFPYFCVPHEVFDMTGTVLVQRLFIRGDYNADGGLDIADPIGLLGHLFGMEPLASCADAGDANDDGTIDIADAVAILDRLFNQGGSLPAPFPNLGADRTADNLLCN